MENLEIDPTRTRVAVVLVNWRAAAMTLRAIDCVLEQSSPPEHIYVVDNGSDDGSVESLRVGANCRSERITLIASDRNLGFGAGCNLAIRRAMAAGYVYLWLLNNDALPERDCLAALLRTAKETPGPLGAVGSLLVDPAGHQAPHFGSWMGSIALTCGDVSRPGDLQRPYSWCTAASLLVEAAALRAIGGFDEDFFMYWEDADLNLRLRRAGFTIACAPDARVLHNAGTSSVSIPVQRYLWHFDSQRRFLSKHHRFPLTARTLLRGKFLLKALFDRDLARFRAIFGCA